MSRSPYMSTERVRSLDPKRVIILDTETTGLKPQGNEILSLSIINLEGTVLFDELVKPEKRKRWPKATEVNGITPQMVADKKTLKEHAERLREIWSEIDLVVGYNVSFDTDFIYDADLDLGRYVPEYDVMREFAPIWGKWDDRREAFRWAKLTQCASYYGIKGFDAHTSLGDAEATRQCFIALLEDKHQRDIKREQENMERDKEEVRRFTEKRRKEMEDRQDQNFSCIFLAFIFVVVLIMIVSGISSCMRSFLV